MKERVAVAIQKEGKSNIRYEKRERSCGRKRHLRGEKKGKKREVPGREACVAVSIF